MEAGQNGSHCLSRFFFLNFWFFLRVFFFLEKRFPTTIAVSQTIARNGNSIIQLSVCEIQFANITNALNRHCAAAAAAASVGVNFDLELNRNLQQMQSK